MHPIYCDIYFILPSAFDILRYSLSCRAIAIYDLPINLRYIYKRVSPLLLRHFVVGLSEKSKKVAARSLVVHDDNDLHLVVPLFPNPYPLEAWLRLAPVQHLQVGIGDLL